MLVQPYFLWLVTGAGVVGEVSGWGGGRADGRVGSNFGVATFLRFH